MIEEVTGIRRIRMLYLQRLYRCNFNCLHCLVHERAPTGRLHDHTHRMA
ncbi:hypothetical protein [Streptomyces sp. NRRL S-350]|nr:hypothetical protein [Streptomyces sp. NRRL S-350]